MAPRKTKDRARRRPGDHGLYWKASRKLWVARIDFGSDYNGKRRRWEATAKTESGARAKLDKALIELANTGAVGSKRMTIDAWLKAWLEQIVRPRVRPRTYDDYRFVCERHLSPALGRARLDTLTPSDVRGALESIAETGRVATARKAHRVLRVALADAQRDGHVPRNVAQLVTPPASVAAEATALDVAQAKAVLAHAREQSGAMASRWQMALLEGARQGECLGLEWDRVNLDDETVTISWQLQRLHHEHGCGPKVGDVWPCGRTVPGRCSHRKVRIPRGFECREVEGGLCLTRPKTGRSEREIPLVGSLAKALRERRAELTKQGVLPVGFVWTRGEGRPIDPKDDSVAWHDLLQGAGVPQIKLHGARHTTVSLLTALGVDPRIIQEIVGHAQVTTTRIYQHVHMPTARAALDELDAALA